MIKQISHPVTGFGVADIALALDLAYALHKSAAPPRAPEVAAPQLMGLRTTAARPHQRKVLLTRLAAMRA